MPKLIEEGVNWKEARAKFFHSLPENQQYFRCCHCFAEFRLLPEEISPLAHDEKYYGNLNYLSINTCPSCQKENQLIEQLSESWYLRRQLKIKWNEWWASTEKIDWFPFVSKNWFHLVNDEARHFRTETERLQAYINKITDEHTQRINYLTDVLETSGKRYGEVIEKLTKELKIEREKGNPESPAEFNPGE